MTHTMQEDFEHFLSYSGNSKQHVDIRSLMWKAFEAGAEHKGPSVRESALEALLSSADAPAKALTAAEWAGLSVETRHNLSVLGMDLDKLAGLVLVLLKTNERGPVRDEIQRLARKYAPPSKPDVYVLMGGCEHPLEGPAHFERVEGGG